MKRTLAIVILAGALPAAAQDQGWIIRFDRAEVTPADPVFWVECWAYFPADDYAFAGARWNLHASEEGWGYGESLLPGLGEPTWYVDGPSFLRIVDGQLNFPPGMIYADPTNPIAVWRANFEVTDFAPREITIHTETHMGAIYPLRESSAAEQRAWTESEGVIRVIPAPAALGLLGLGALAGAQRRRRRASSVARAAGAAGALGAFAGGASAQSDTGLFFEAPDTLSPSQPSITLHLWAEIPASDYLFAAARFDAHASEPGWSNPELVLRGPGQDPGTVVGSDVVGVVVGQLSFPPAPPPSVNPVEIWRITFTITDFHPRTVSLSTETSLFYVYPDPSSGVGEPRASHEATHEIRVIPAPGALGLLGLGALAATPRRRRS